MSFDEILIHKGFQILDDKSENRHKIIVAIIDKLKLDRFKHSCKPSSMLYDLLCFFSDFL